MRRFFLCLCCVLLTVCGCVPKAPALTPQDAIDAFKAAGLEAEGCRAMAKDDYGMAPMLATDGIRFLVPSVCADCGGRVMAFDGQEDLAETQAFYVDLGKQSALFFSWVFVQDNVLVQITGDLPEDQAAKYAAALASLGE